MKEFLQNYTVTICGKVFNKRGHELRGYINHKGYRVIDLYLCGKRKAFRVHQLVASLFVSGKTSNRNTVNHRNKNRADNRWFNLEWLSNQEQQDHRWGAR